MRQEGRLIENEYYKGRYWDTLMYAILDREWQARHSSLDHSTAINDNPPH
jgi:hypothetical protein